MKKQNNVVIEDNGLKVIIERALSEKNPTVKEYLENGWKFIGSTWDREKNMYLGTMVKDKDESEEAEVIGGAVFIGNAEKCLQEAGELVYAYFSPMLDDFHGETTVDDICFKVITELDLLESGDLKIHAQDTDYKWNAMRNKSWKKKTVAFLNRWASETENEAMYSK